MAYTRIHAIKTTVNKSIAYICDSTKTDGELYISSYACSPQTAHLEFDFTSGKTIQSGTNKAFHLIQSFAPGEVSFEEAHRIGNELADKVLEGKYAYVVATHIEKNHVHNHIIFAATSHMDHHKYNACKRTYNRIRNLSDELCNEHGLSVINAAEKSNRRSRKIYINKDGLTPKEQLIKDIDECIKKARNYDSFLDLMKARGYEIKGDAIDDSGNKYIAFKPPGASKFIRGREKTLGANYTREQINNRIISESSTTLKIPRKIPKEARFIDTSDATIASSPGLTRWADKQNLKAAAATYASAGSIMELREKIDAKITLLQDTKATIKSLDTQLKDLGELLYYANMFIENKRYHAAYKRSSDPDAYLRDRRNNHEAKLIMYDSAKRYLESHGLSTSNINIEKLRSQYDALLARKETASDALERTRKDKDKLQEQLENLEKYLGDDITIQPEKNKKNER